jgi:hypothetical protein
MKKSLLLTAEPAGVATDILPDPDTGTVAEILVVVDEATVARTGLKLTLLL